MFRIRRLPLLSLAALTFVLAVLALALPQLVQAKPQETLTVDVAQNMLTFVADETPVHEDGMPAYGNMFIIQGYIYPEGTLEDGNGILVRQAEDGNPVAEPEFPDLVIGEWICRGWFVGDGLHTQDDAWAITTQLFNLGEGYGDKTIVSEGYEIPFGLQAALTRAITGGSGDYAGVEGNQQQSVVGLNASQAANFRIELNFEKK